MSFKKQGVEQKLSTCVRPGKIRVCWVRSVSSVLIFFFEQNTDPIAAKRTLRTDALDSTYLRRADRCLFVENVPENDDSHVVFRVSSPSVYRYRHHESL